MKYFFLYFLFFLSFVCFGQNQKKIDSLKAEVKKNTNNEVKFELLSEIFNNYLFLNLDSAAVYKDKIIKLFHKDKNRLINVYGLSSKYFYYKSDLDSALYFTKKALSIAVELNDNKLKADLYRKLAILSSREHKYDDAEHFGELALKTAILTNDWHLIASSNIMLGNQYYKKTDFDLALKYYLKADSLYTLNNEEDRFLANSYDNISSIYTDIKDKRAIYYIEKSKKIYQNLNDLEGINYNFLLKGMYYYAIKDYKNAIHNFETAIKFYEEYGETFRQSDLYSRLVSSYSAIGEFNKAEQVLKKVELLLKKSNEKGILIAMYLSGGQLYLDQNKYNDAIKYFEKAHVIINSSEISFSINQLREINKGLSLAYLGKKDYKNALKYSQLHLLINDSIYKNNNIEVTKNLETKYQTEKKEQEITLLKSKNELAEQQKTNQRNQLLGGIGITSLAGLFFFFLYRNRQKTTKKLQELDKAKSNFFANISHEFRTPLTLISSPIQKQLQKENLPDDERNNFEMMHRNSTRLLSLVDQLLDISKIEAGSLKLKVSKIELMPFIGSLTDGFTYAAKQKELNYIINNNPTTNITWFDKDVLEKIVVNLLSNAIKYTPTKGSIVCNAFVKESQFYFEVKNTGLGLSKDELTKIFERFYQLNENEQGVGIGLALVKELINLHKGTINVESIPDEWTTFKVVLPINKEAFKEDEFDKRSTDKFSDEQPIYQEVSEINRDIDMSKDPDSHQDDNPILLMVDDNADIRTYVSNIFNDTYTILTAKNGQEGIDLALEHIPDIIISDIMMPVKNGIELCNTLKVDERTSHIPIILLTAKAGEENEIEGVKTGADDYVTKPFNEELLKLRVQKLIESRNKLQLRYSQEVILRPKDIAITSVDEQFLERLQKVLDDKLVESSFSIENFSKVVGMSRMQLHRKLKALTGLSATEFIRSQRLKLAAQLLKKSEINVSQVGYSVGFSDHAYFSKCFKKMYHCTPTEYANNTK
ncbi:MAG: response regulator [Flavobacteriaceae bacterium]|nr:response regulator [Flavobacteriaceae bacterium]